MWSYTRLQTTHHDRISSVQNLCMINRVHDAELTPKLSFYVAMNEKKAESQVSCETHPQ